MKRRNFKYKIRDTVIVPDHKYIVYDHTLLLDWTEKHDQYFRNKTATIKDIFTNSQNEITVIRLGVIHNNRELSCFYHIQWFIDYILKRSTLLYRIE